MRILFTRMAYTVDKQVIDGSNDATAMFRSTPQTRLYFRALIRTIVSCSKDEGSEVSQICGKGGLFR